MKLALNEFVDFRRSHKLYELIVEIDKLEEGDVFLFTEATRDLYVNCTDYKELIARDTMCHLKNVAMLVMMSQI